MWRIFIMAAVILTSACASINISGDKQALFELGRRYETGNGVPIDLKRARRYYRAAANPTPNTIPVYSPPVGKSTGQVLFLNTGRGAPGLPAAKTALARVTAALKRPRCSEKTF